MKQEYAARHLDLRAFSRAHGTLSGELPLVEFERLKAETQDSAGTTVCWEARGEVRSADGGGEEIWLHLAARATLVLVCQRCMGRAETLVASDRWFRFAPDEASAAVLDDESEEDVLVLGGAFDLIELVEDELLMSLPLVPRHERCPVDVKLSVADPDFEETAANPSPFAKLASLRVDKSG